jgi:hypothetical protein
VLLFTENSRISGRRSAVVMDYSIVYWQKDRVESLSGLLMLQLSSKTWRDGAPPVPLFSETTFLLPTRW